MSDVGRILFIKGLQEADSGKYTCSAVYTSSQRLEAHVNLTTIGQSNKYFLIFQSYVLVKARRWICFWITVGITWEDAPTEQSAIFGQPYKVRCVVRANPPATIDWQKNGVGFTTSKFLFFTKTLLFDFVGPCWLFSFIVDIPFVPFTTPPFARVKMQNRSLWPKI